MSAKVKTYEMPWNFSVLCNAVVKVVDGEIVDVVVIARDSKGRAVRNLADVDVYSERHALLEYIEENFTEEVDE